MIYCNPPRDVDIGVGINGLQRVWKLNAPLGQLRWYQSSSQQITCFGFYSIGSGGALWLYQNRGTGDQMLHCYLALLLTISCFLPPLSSWHRPFALYFGKWFKSKMQFPREFAGLHIIRDSLAQRIYLSQALLLDRLLEKEFLGIMRREGLTGNGLGYNPGFWFAQLGILVSWLYSIWLQDGTYLCQWLPWSTWYLILLLFTGCK